MIVEHQGRATDERLYALGHVPKSSLCHALRPLDQRRWARKRPQLLEILIQTLGELARVDPEAADMPSHDAKLRERREAFPQVGVAGEAQLLEVAELDARVELAPPDRRLLLQER